MLSPCDMIRFVLALGSCLTCRHAANQHCHAGPAEPQAGVMLISLFLSISSVRDLRTGFLVEVRSIKIVTSIQLHLHNDGLQYTCSQDGELNL